ncbi:Scavenger mRNA decapping enzyme C-term binding [Shewanella psychrophila]|uniref:Scavenger mRNA decapping enzyme C-term binding n=2 Tax=Shewanella TaxID=22 RepID=A0A1S6HQ24_9GAMM|nr:hypothetical protein [Shewanella psychrophila]AQS37626.1 Scavenger mRNA decapping enzyme C-term binding [Shewanella psychrophila]
MNTIQTLQRASSTMTVGATPNLNQSIDVCKVRNIHTDLEKNGHSQLRRTLDAYGIDDNRNTLSHLNQDKYNVFVKKDKSGTLELSHGAYISKVGVDEYGAFRWLNPRGLKKYQTNDLAQVTLSMENLKQLQATYKDENTTEFLVNLLRGDSAESLDNVYTSLYKKQPDVFHYSGSLNQGNGFLIYPNIPYMSETYTNGHHKDLADRREGVQLTAWAVHPALPLSLIQEITDVHPIGKPSVTQGEELNQRKAESKWTVKSLTSILDLEPKDLKMLEKLKSDIIGHLSDTYGVSAEKDNVDLFFHFPVAPSTATLHLHIWVNKGDHPLNESRAFGLNEVIEHLRNDENINSLILSRNEGLFTLPKKDALHLIKGMPGSYAPTIEVREKFSLPITGR